MPALSRARITLAVAFSVITLAACGPSGQPQGGGFHGFPPAEVVTQVVAPRSIPVAFEYVGQTYGSKDVEVRARVNGIVEKRLYQEGTAVRAGQPLFVIDARPYAAQVAAADAEVARAEAQKAQADRESARLKPLAERKAIGQKEADDAASAADLAAAAVKAARAKLVELNLNLAYTRVNAPIAGLTSRAQVSEGALAVQNQTLLTTISQIDPIWVGFTVSENVQLRLNRAAADNRLVLPKDNAYDVTVKLSDGTAFGKRGRINFSDTRINPATGTYEMRAELPNGDAALKPPGWDATPSPHAGLAQTDMVIYELHVRDFSINDASVPGPLRGKYAAFTQADSLGMRHLRALADAGLTDVHLLPVFDLATVPEVGCVTPTVAVDGPAGEAAQAAVMAVAAKDCFNWGYDPLHYNAPEGSYASDANDGAARVREFRAMVQALHRAGLRVGMDVVYNHTSASGQDPRSVLDRIVPGYYQRLDGKGAVERSTCCANTATEHAMMARLMIDSVRLWATQYRIDSFRFDLMAHQPRAVMEALQADVDAATGRHVNLIGEGWNFGEIANGARFVQASQLSLNGSGIGTFSDRGRDAVRGGSAGDSGRDMLARQGYVNGLVYARNAAAPARTAEDLRKAADMVRVGLAGSLRDYRMQTQDGSERALADIPYGDQPAGYVSQPAEVVNYIENHDNQTLYDINALKLPRDTPAAERARVQVLAMAINAFSQGVAYYHAGVDLLRSKSLDRNSYDSGDWFNRLDWSAQDNFFGTGLPPKPDNGKDWDLLRPVLADAAIKPAPADIAFARAAFRDLLRIRASTRLFRLPDAGAIRARLRFENTGPAQDPAVLAAHLDGRGLEGADFAELLYLVNVSPEPRALVLPAERGKNWRLHPVHLAPGAADTRPREQAGVDAATGRFTVPARTALVYVVN